MAGGRVSRSMSRIFLAAAVASCFIFTKQWDRYKPKPAPICGQAQAASAKLPMAKTNPRKKPVVVFQPVQEATVEERKPVPAWRPTAKRQPRPRPKRPESKKPTPKKVGNTVTVRFSRPPKDFGPQWLLKGGFNDSAIASRIKVAPHLKKYFERARKVEADIGGDVVFKVTLRRGWVRSVKMTGNAKLLNAHNPGSPPLYRIFANFLHRCRWEGKYSRTYEFPITFR